jgi:exodeoxyribonuclease VII small subunit
MSKKKLTFEEAMRELEEKVNGLESGNMTLEESLKAFSEAMSLINVCNSKLDGAKEQVRVLMEKEDGSITDAPFNNAPFDTEIL